MVLLVEGVQDLRVGENLVQTLAGIKTRIARQPERKLPRGAELRTARGDRL
jgi:hypothetical protein